LRFSSSVESTARKRASAQKRWSVWRNWCMTSAVNLLILGHDCYVVKFFNFCICVLFSLVSVWFDTKNKTSRLWRHTEFVSGWSSSLCWRQQASLKRL
jgi:hypothetical protein